MKVKPEDGEDLKFYLLWSLGQEDQKFKAFWVVDQVQVPWHLSKTPFQNETYLEG